ncbi:MCE family protein [Mycobacterium sp. URHD0025]|uniref:MCE family protein n=1 Tax=Mycobacterium sp. URHD0025 TaxID=1298864 RepID=UPI00041C0959|nr:MCE family protein [Mycobacterium sp. URHD0025]
MTRSRITRLTALLLAALLVSGVAWLVHLRYFAPRTLRAIFTTATAVYPGDQVKVSGVRVGTIKSIEPDGAAVRMTMTVDRHVPIPADARAVIVAQNLISARYVQLTPPYRWSGPTMSDGAEIPLERTAVPVEWDEVKDQLNRLASELGPQNGVSGTATARVIDSAANAMAGNGPKLRETLAQLSSAGRILADGSGDIVGTIKNLQKFITTLKASSTQIVEFQDRLASLTSVLDGSKSDLDAMLANVSEVVGEVERFVRDTRDPAAEQVRGLASVTQTVVDHQRDLKQILHVAPTAIANTLNMFDPRDGGATGTFTFVNFSNPVEFLCGAIGAIENTTAPETAKLCNQYLGPALKQMNFNYLPFPVNPGLTSVPPPEDLLYTEPGLAPGGSGPKPGAPETPPAVSAYTGVGDVPAPPGYGPPPGQLDLSGMLMPASPPEVPAPPLPESPRPAEEGAPPR